MTRSSSPALHTRLVEYRGLLEQYRQRGLRTVSLEMLADAAGVSMSKAQRDLTLLGLESSPFLGCIVGDLLAVIGQETDGPSDVGG